jgi:NAD(P)-dependent dehydrogenase (short-subunit alcohol dehydrogenase family)
MEVPAPARLLDFSGKTVAVTGAGSGIGSGIALRFAEAGARMALNYRRSEAGARTLAAKIEALGGQAVLIQADVSSASGAQLLLDQAVAAFGGIDVLVNNAGSYPFGLLMETSAADWDEALAVNLRSVHLCTQATARRMAAQKRGGAIVNIASIEAWNPAPGHASYDAAKAAVVMYTRAAAAELGQYAIRVNCVSPGLIWREGLEAEWPEGVAAYTQAAPLGRLGRADDVADACLFLASPAGRWITGINLVVDGGVLTHRVY